MNDFSEDLPEEVEDIFFRVAARLAREKNGQDHPIYREVTALELHEEYKQKLDIS